MDNGSGRSFALSPGPVARVGAMRQAEVALGDDAPPVGICLLACEAGIYCLDLRPSEITERASAWVLPEVPIKLGPYSIAVGLEHGPLPTPPRRQLTARGSAAPPWPVLNVSYHGESYEKTLRRGVVVVGRGSSCYLKIHSRKLSTRHCLLYTERGRLWVIDLFSTNGTWLAGERVDVAEVPLGATVDLKEVQIEFTRLAEAEVEGGSDVAEDSGFRGQGSGVTTGDSASAIIAALRVEQEALRAERVAWEAEREQQEHQLQAQAAVWDERVAELAAQRAELQQQTEAFAQQQYELTTAERLRQVERDDLRRRKHELNRRSYAIEQRAHAVEQQEKLWEQDRQFLQEESRQQREALSSQRTAQEETARELAERLTELRELRGQLEADTDALRQKQQNLQPREDALDLRQRQLADREAALRNMETEVARQGETLDQRQALLDAEESRFAHQQQPAATEPAESQPVAAKPTPRPASRDEPLDDEYYHDELATSLMASLRDTPDRQTGLLVRRSLLALLWTSAALAILGIGYAALNLRHVFAGLLGE